jgi:hypothetical protein
MSSAENIPGWMTKKELAVLSRLAHQYHTIVEVGSHKGRSTRALGDSCRGVVHAVDPWPEDNDPVLGPDEPHRLYHGVYGDFLDNMSDLIAIGRVVPHRAQFERGMFEPDSVDMVFIDGVHLYEYVKHDINVALELIRPGGLVSGHDYQLDSVAEAVDEAFGSRVKKERTIWMVSV